jgi:hypothetical protein
MKRSVPLNLRQLISGICLIATTCAWVEAQPKHQEQPQQTHFSAEDAAFPNPVPVPGDVLELLEKETVVRDALKNNQDADNKVPQSWFSATELQLRLNGKADLLVRAEPPLAGANTDYFWVFRNFGSGYVRVLGGAAHDLEIRNRRSLGSRDIAFIAMTAAEMHTVVYRFNGKRYVVYREKSEPIK